MRTDRYFYDPGPLAIAKGIAYLIAFFTTVQFDNAGDPSYYIGIILFCCGMVCDYFEIAAYKEDKCDYVRIISLTIGVVLTILIALLGILLIQFKQHKMILDFVSKYLFEINMLFCFFWVLPLWNGFTLCCKAIKRKKRKKGQPSTKYPAGYYVKPKSD